MESLRFQIRRARTHPSMLVWLNGSDNPPPADIETQYLAIEKELNWPCPTISSATAKAGGVGTERREDERPLQMGAADLLADRYEERRGLGLQHRGRPRRAPPPLESLEAMLPPEHRWPIDKVWDFHCGGGAFKNIERLHRRRMDARFGKSTGIADFAWKAQAQAYETIRAMFEGFRANKFKATGEIQWMLNNAWPSMIWHLYDYYLRPGAAYFATKLACEPLHVLLRYDNQAVVVANDTLQPYADLTVAAEIYDASAKLVQRQEAACTAPANSATTDADAQSAGRHLDHLLRAARAQGQGRQGIEREFLLVVDRAGRVGLGEDGLEHHAVHVVRRLHAAGKTAAGRAGY